MKINIGCTSPYLVGSFVSGGGCSSQKVQLYGKRRKLFKNPILRFILIHANAFPVKRDKKPGPSAVKTPVKILKDTDLSLIMFPSGTRHSTALKGWHGTDRQNGEGKNRSFCLSRSLKR